MVSNYKGNFSIMPPAVLKVNYCFSRTDVGMFNVDLGVATVD